MLRYVSALTRPQVGYLSGYAYVPRTACSTQSPAKEPHAACPKWHSHVTQPQHEQAILAGRCFPDGRDRDGRLRGAWREFGRHGLDVTITNYTSVEQEIQALSSGRADVAAGDYADFFYKQTHSGRHPL